MAQKGPDNKVKWGTMSCGVSILNAMVVSCSHGPMALYRSPCSSCLMAWSWCAYKGVDSIT